MGERTRPAPQGMYMSSVKVGPKGQIVIPKEARALFDIQAGDTLLLLADEKRGIAIHRYEVLKRALDNAISEYELSHGVPAKEEDETT